ncbi:MAG: cupin domain-containing protein [Actinomycetota bacterium]|nr:cupin domain-containing protein [Actinomycetota bacterium]
MGDAVTFLETSEETGGERTLIELEAASGGGTAAHYHLTYSERFRVLEGRLTVEVDGAQYELGPGDEALAPAGSLHRWRNLRSERAVAHVEVRPGHAGFERTLRVGYALASEGRVFKNGTPRNPLYTAQLLEWSNIRLPGIYTALERVLKVLARVARRRGIERELARRYL